MTSDDDLIINPKAEDASSKDPAAGDTSALHVDADWKVQAQAEKARLVKEEQDKVVKAGDAGKAGRGETPTPDFRAMLGLLTQQAIMGLGVVRDEKSGGVVVDLEGARFFIDLLGMLEEKTKGNLTEEEKLELTQLVHELRGRYVQITQAVSQSVATGDVAAGEAGPTLGGVT